MLIPYVLCFCRFDFWEDGRNPSGPVIVTFIDNMLLNCVPLRAIQTAVETSTKDAFFCASDKHANKHILKHCVAILVSRHSIWDDEGKLHSSVLVECSTMALGGLITCFASCGVCTTHALLQLALSKHSGKNPIS